LSKAQRTPGGGARIPAVVTRSGVFEYTQTDGTIVREYRPPDEVAKADSLASLCDAPVTYMHPAKPVDATSWRAVSVGHVSGDPKPGAEGVATALVVNDADTLAKIDGGIEAVEVSCGYSVEIDATPGVTPSGERYDRIQRQITYNHVAIGPKDWGRQGGAVSLRLDGAGHQVCNEAPVDVGSQGAKAKCSDCGLDIKNDAKCPDCGYGGDMPADGKCPKCGMAMRADAAYPWDDCMREQMAKYGDEATARKVCGAIKAANDSKDSPMKIKVRVDGVEHETEAGSSDHIQLQARADAANAAALAAATKRADEATARADTAATEIVALKKTVAELPAQVRKDAAARAELETKAAAILGAEYKFDGKDDRTVRVDAIRKIDPTFADADRSPDYLAARFDGLAAPSAAAELAAKLDRADTSHVGSDFDHDKYVADARAASRDAWRPKPVADTKADN
jgi:hypothetical protein